MIVRTLTCATLLLLVSAAARGQEAADSSAVQPVVALPSGAAHRWQTGALRADRLQHASLAFAIGAGVGATTGRAEIGAGSALVLGVAKECLDDHFDRGDLVADTVGAALAALLVAALTR